MTSAFFRSIPTTLCPAFSSRDRVAAPIPEPAPVIANRPIEPPIRFSRCAGSVSSAVRTQWGMPLDKDAYLAALEREGQLLASAGERGLGAIVLACPGWT